jgi:hypothetical protein
VGAVFNSATNAAIPRALVTFFGSATGFRFTDAGGSFRVDDVSCGQHTISVSKPGFVGEGELSGQRNPAPFAPDSAAGDQENEQGPRAPDPAVQIVDVEPGSAPARIRLVPLASIAGTVVDENGEPLEGVIVQAISVRTSLDGADYVPSGKGRTDDRGHYSLLNLRPGDYLVRLAGEVSSTAYFVGTKLSPNNDHRGMQPVYYPNADAESAAQVIHLGGGDRASADFQRPSEAAYDINGRLTGFVPGIWTQIQMYREGDRVPLGRAYVNLSSGQFRVVDVPRGHYTLRTVQYQTDPPLWLAAETPVAITSEPVQDLQVGLVRGADIPVSVTYEAGAEARGFANLELRSLRTTRDTRRLSLGGGRAKVPRAGAGQLGQDADDSPPEALAFTDVLPDRYRLIVTTAGNDYVSSARLGDQEVLHGEFTISGGGAGELHLTMRGDSASVEGQVTLQGKPAMAASVYLITSRENRIPKVGFSDEAGHFQIAGVPPGDYRIRAWQGAPALTDMAAGAGDSLTVQAGEHRTVTLEAAQGSDPQGGRQR